MTYEVDKPKKGWATYDGEEIAPKSVNGVLTLVTEDEAKQIVADRKEWEDSKDDRLLKSVREARQPKLDSSDWTQLADSPLDESDKSEWAEWRQELRDITDESLEDLKKLLDSKDESVTWAKSPAEKEQE